jgi:predicted NBD/HSP70 family sugar kinase
VSGSEGNGHLPEFGEDELDDDAPLDAAEAAEGAAAADEEADETLDERVGAVIEALDGVTRERDDGAVTYAVGGRAFAVLMPDLLEVALDPSIATAALRTPDTLASSRGKGWIAFTPDGIDRFALDRAEAWVRLAHRRAAEG